MRLQAYLKQLLRLSIPIILGQIGTVLMGIIDILMLGKVSKYEIAAVGIANQIYFLITVFGIGIMATLSPLVATSKGANKNRDCGELLRTGIELGFLLSIILCTILILLIENFFIFQQPEEIKNIAIDYLRMLTVSTLPFLLFVALKQYSDGLSLTKPAMYITLIAVFIKIAINYVLIFGLFSFPQCGATGAGISTLICRIIMALILVVYIFKNSIYNEFLPNLVSMFKTGPVILKLLKVGIPSGIQMFLEISAFTGTAILVGWLGANYLAAHQILLGILAIIYTTAVGFSSAGSIQVATYLGAGNNKGINTWSNFTFIIVIISLTFISVILYYFNGTVISLFTKDKEVSINISSAFSLMIIFLIIDGIQITSIGLLRSIQDVKMPGYITLSSYILIGLPLSYLLAFYFQLNLKGIWIGLITGGLTCSVILSIRYYFLVKAYK